MKKFYKKVVSDCLIIEEIDCGGWETKNVKIEKIERRIYKAVELECGHKHKLTEIGRKPVNGTRCLTCYFDSDEFCDK